VIQSRPSGVQGIGSVAMSEHFRGRAVYALVSVHIAIFGALVIAAAGLGYIYAREQIALDLEQRMSRRMTMLVAADRNGGTPKLIDAIKVLGQRGAKSFSYLLLARDGRRLAGISDVEAVRLGWAEIPLLDSDDQNIELVLAYTVLLPDGRRLTVVADRDFVHMFDNALLVFLGVTFFLVLSLATAGGLLIDRAVRTRLLSITRTAGAIVDGDLSRRIPVSSRRDEFDAVAAVLNGMLDRVEALVGELGRLNSYVAHDLRAPILEVRRDLQMLVEHQAAGHTMARGLGQLQDKCTEILQLFDAILAIGQMGHARHYHAMVDLSALTGELCEAFQPAIEESGRTLRTAIESGVSLVADSGLMGQLLVNLIENALHHTNVPTEIRVSLGQSAGIIQLVVADNGRSSAGNQPDALFDNPSASPGTNTSRSSLGLKLVRAIATAHGGVVSITHNRPGVAITVRLPLQRALESA
jgi:signal transduction histidine kinase